MRILIHSNAPWVPTGYGVQARLLAEQLSLHGHTVAFSAFSGLGGADITWRSPGTAERLGRKYLVMPSGQMAFGLDMLVLHAIRFDADVVITLMDTYKLAALGAALGQQKFAVLAWTPVDCTPLSKQDEETFAVTGITPVAMSIFGHRQLTDALSPTVVNYAPHAVDTVNDYYPMDDRLTFRNEVGLDDKFVIGLCAANKDTMRKAFPEQFEAFAEFHKAHKDSVLLVHSVMHSISGIDLSQLAGDMGIPQDAIMFTEQYIQDSGLFDTDMMRRWYNVCDILSLCSYGEGFGVPLIEAQACGTPVVTSSASATGELVGVGRTVNGTRFWNPLHRAYWSRPHVREIAKAYTELYLIDDLKHGRDDARNFALKYDTDMVYNRYWEPILKEISNVHD